MTTLVRSFKHCRAFADSSSERPHKNMVSVAYVQQAPTHLTVYDLGQVVFCSPSRTVVFRKAQEGDFLDSPMREIVLSGFESNEVDLSTLVDVGDKEELWLRDGEGERRLEEWQTASAVEHWHIMRSVLPQEAWLIY
jgi:hypothetical protein